MNVAAFDVAGIFFRAKYRSYHIIIPVRVTVHQIRKRDILKIFRNELIQSPPHGERATFSGAGTNISAGIKAGNRSHRIFCDAQNVFHSVLLRRFCQLISAALPPYAGQQLCLYQQLDNVL